MFFEPRVWKKTEEKIYLPATVTVIGFEGYAETVLSEWISRFANGEGTFSVTAIQDTDIPAEGYAIVLRKDATEVRYADLRGMIYADAEHKICPFCGKELAKTEDAFECGACRTVIRENICPETGERYYSTEIKHFSKAKTKKFVASDAAYHFRNITPVSESGALLCPECGKEH
jgi:predicted RNA-binding Zn-ribbon protein involved in translation (DUF1610 family)